MAAPTVPYDLKRLRNESERALITYATAAQTMLSSQYSIRNQMIAIDRDYMRENDFTEANVRARIANAGGDASKFRDITVPIIMPQVEAALGYMTNVFLTGYPIFGPVGAPDVANAALQMETLVAENSVTAGWSRQLMMFFRDGLKYNLHALECEWDQKTVATIETDLNFPNSAKPKTVVWQGNCIKRMDLYNTFWDPRVQPADIHSQGEFAGYIDIMSRVRMKKYLNDLFGQVPAETVIRAFESNPGTSGVVTTGSGPFSYFVPSINPSPLQLQNVTQSFDWLGWALNIDKTNGIKYSNIYNVTKIYCRLIPKDFGLSVPEENTPQVWKLIIINNSVIVWMERMTNAHGFIPILFGQPLEDGLAYQTKSFATNVTDMQYAASAMVNGYIASKRRLVGDRVLYDPLRVREADINNTNPAAKIPVRPSAFGKPVGEAVYAFPYRDEQVNSMLQGAQEIGKMANLVNNQNPVQQGQFQKGNKTRHEYDDTMGHGNMKNQGMALMTEFQVFVPAKEIIKLNYLQYQGDAILYNQNRQQNVAIKIQDLRKTAVHFKMSDGMQPSDKLVDGDVLQTAIQAMGSSPQIAIGYNIAPAFSYLMKQQGLDLRPFEKSPLQMQYEQAVEQWKMVAIEAIKQGKEPPPQPQMPPELIKELQLKQQQGGIAPTETGLALESTVAGTDASITPSSVSSPSHSYNGASATGATSNA